MSLRANFVSVAIFLILILSLAIRLYNLDYPLSYIFAWGDGTRDYFVANHIVKYGEFIFLGPFNLLNEAGIYNSPVYYYLLALFLVPYNHVLTLGIVNIIFQLFTIFLIYLIAKKLFDEKAALLAALIFSFTPEILAQSDYIWQPHLSQPFAYLALLLAVLFYQKGRYIYLLSSILSLTFSFVLHNSTFPWIPLFLVTSFFMLRKHKAKTLGLLVAFFISLALLYLPVGLFLTQSDLGTNLTFSLSAQNINEYFNNFQINLNGILKAFNINNFWFGIISVLTAFYLLKSKDEKTKIVLLILLILILSPVFFASFFNKFRLHYLTLSLGALAIFLGFIFTSFSRYKIITLVVISLLLLTTTNNFQFLKFQKMPLENLKLVDNLSQRIIDEVGSSDSFQIKSYAMDEKIFEYPTLDTIFLIPLEDKLNRKLAILTDKSPFNHQQIGGREYFIVVCHEFGNLAPRFEECLQVFKRSYPNYAIVKNLYIGTNIAIYFSKHD